MRIQLVKNSVLTKTQRARVADMGFLHVCVTGNIQSQNGILVNPS